MSDVAHAQDETIDGAAMHMPDLDELEIANGDREAESNRDDLGRFKASQEEAGKDAEDEAEQTAKEADENEPEKEAEAEDDEDYFVQTRAAEGEEPTGRKATEGFEGYQRAQ